MKSYSQKTAEYLETDGWKIKEILTDNLEWWADEIWCIESIWSPKGVHCYITFLVDPQFEINRQKGQGVWALGLSSIFPKSRSDAQGSCTLSIGKCFKNEIEEFLLEAEKLRNI